MRGDPGERRGALPRAAAVAAPLPRAATPGQPGNGCPAALLSLPPPKLAEHRQLSRCDPGRCSRPPPPPARPAPRTRVPPRRQRREPCSRRAKAPRTHRTQSSGFGCRRAAGTRSPAAGTRSPNANDKSGDFRSQPPAPLQGKRPAPGGPGPAPAPAPRPSRLGQRSHPRSIPAAGPRAPARRAPGPERPPGRPRPCGPRRAAEGSGTCPGERPRRARGPRGADGGGWGRMREDGGGLGLTGCAMAPSAAAPAERRGGPARGLMGSTEGPVRSLRCRACAVRAAGPRGAASACREVLPGGSPRGGVPGERIGASRRASSRAFATSLPGPAWRHLRQAVPRRYFRQARWAPPGGRVVSPPCSPRCRPPRTRVHRGRAEPGGSAERAGPGRGREAGPGGGAGGRGRGPERTGGTKTRIRLLEMYRYFTHSMSDEQRWARYTHTQIKTLVSTGARKDTHRRSQRCEGTGCAQPGRG